jgi:hypothetical protein
MDAAYYEPVFTRKDRDGKLSLWVKMPDCEEWNICDIGYRNDDEKVLKAIIHAFELGMIAHERMVRNVTCSVSGLAGFKETVK